MVTAPAPPHQGAAGGQVGGPSQPGGTTDNDHRSTRPLVGVMVAGRTRRVGLLAEEELTIPSDQPDVGYLDSSAEVGTLADEVSDLPGMKRDGVLAVDIPSGLMPNRVGDRSGV